MRHLAIRCTYLSSLRSITPSASLLVCPSQLAYIDTLEILLYPTSMMGFLGRAQSRNPVSGFFCLFFRLSACLFVHLPVFPPTCSSALIFDVRASKWLSRQKCFKTFKTKVITRSRFPKSDTSKNLLLMGGTKFFLDWRGDRLWWGGCPLMGYSPPIPLCQVALMGLQRKNLKG